MRNIVVIGKGSWGNALAHALTFHGQVKTMGHILEQSAIESSDIIIIATPSHAFISIIQKLSHYNLRPTQILLIATKGLVASPASLLSEIAENLLTCIIGVISGPNFASEVIRDQFTATNLAIKNNIQLTESLARTLSSPNFRIYASSNIESIQIAGAMKNIMAIWAGISEGRHLGHNTLSYILTLGLQEIKQLISVYIDDVELDSFAIFGDYYLTTTSNQSRNYRFGLELARHPTTKTQEIIQHYPTLVEGKNAVYTALDLAQRHAIKLPLTNLLLQIFEEKCSINEAIIKLYKI